MSRNSSTEKTRVTAAIEEYVSPILSGHDDGRPLSAIQVSRQLKISRMTIRKYGLDRYLKDAERTRISKKGDVASEVDRLRLRAQIAEEVAAMWQRRYEELVQHRVRIELALRSSREIDLDSILGEKLDAPDRSRPAPAGRNARKKRLYF